MDFNLIHSTDGVAQYLQTNTTIQTFDCGVDHLNRFIQEDAPDFYKHGICKPVLLCDTAGDLMAYAALAASATQLSNFEVGELGANIHIPTNFIPSIRLTHFAVGKPSHGQGLGSRFLSILKDLLLKQWNELCAFRLLVVDARHEVRQFYEQNGFFECSATKAQKKRHTIEMYYDLLGAD